MQSDPPVLLRLWSKIPVLIRAITLGVAIQIVGVIAWEFLFQANLANLRNIPWATVGEVVFLWGFWSYLGGSGTPRSTSESRRINLRARRIRGDALRWSLIVGALGSAGGLALHLVVSRMGTGHTPSRFDELFAGIPGWTVLVWSLTIALMAGVVEETAWRGYMQGPIERRHGPLIAIVSSSTIFTVIHLAQPRVTLLNLIPIMLLALMFGLLAWATNSILPGVFFHVLIDAVAVPMRVFGLLRQDSIWEQGVDASFIASAVAAAVLLIAAIAAIPRFLRETRPLRSQDGP